MTLTTLTIVKALSLLQKMPWLCLKETNQLKRKIDILEKDYIKNKAKIKIKWWENHKSSKHEQSSNTVDG